MVILVIDRSLVQFDLSSIKKGAKIQQAKLYLYGAQKLPSGGHSSLSGSNEVLIQRITSPWDENSINWSTQPTTSDQNQIITPASKSDYQDYVIDVTNLVQDMVSMPKNSHGFMFRQLTEQYYRRMNFASSDYHDPGKWPKLVISYYKDIDEYKSENPEEEDEVFIEQENNLPDLGDMINIYPKHTKKQIYIDNGAYMRIKNYKLNIIDKYSNILYKSIISDKNFKIDISSLGVAGTYFVKILSLKDEIIDIQKIIVE
ncbi:MAG: DNRLRE domain-containing protein [Chloroflexia bacterium]|nr:DNRLRE domain-containing protein [Chloroflexia bacterium]